MGELAQQLSVVEIGMGVCVSVRKMLPAKRIRIVFLTCLVTLCFFVFCWRFPPAQAVQPVGSPLTASNQSTATTPGDNSACILCHQNFQDEVITEKHREAGVACIDCHGVSADHAGDELNIMLPDVMFGRREIEPFCSQCHRKQDHPKGELYQSFLNEWLGKYRPNGRIVRNNSICTDCHGNHAVLSVDQLQFPPG